MSIETGDSPLARDTAGAPPEPGHDGLPRNWREALVGLVFARFGIIRIEAKSAFSAATTGFFILVFGLFALFSAWVLALAAAIAAIAASTSWEWYHVAFAAAGIHLLAGIVLFLILKSRKIDSFPVTLAEFEKDREWLNRLK